jgi:purine nucleosidase
MRVRAALQGLLFAALVLGLGLGLVGTGVIEPSTLAARTRGAGDRGLVPLRYDTILRESSGERVWIDTDAACGQEQRTDPDDCLAIALLAQARNVEVVGISTVFGNATRPIVDVTVHTLVRLLPERAGTLPTVWSGASSPFAGSGWEQPTPATAGLERGLSAGPLTIVALGPLTNIAEFLRRRPELATRVTRIVVVMGRRPGHLFHPSEGARAPSFFGHGPVFRDFNFALDPAAARVVVSSAIDLALVPYDAARGIEFGPEDMATLEHSGHLGQWLASTLRPWLAYWRRDIGRAGFYPFDMVAATVLTDPASMRCAEVLAWIGRDDRVPFAGLQGQTLLVSDPRSPSTAGDAPGRRALYCAAPQPELKIAALRRLAAAARQ